MNQSSLELNNILTKDVKKTYGIFFTPQSIIQDFYPKVIKHLEKKEKYNFLEPSCGSCEFIDSLQKDAKFIDKNNYTFDAIEYNSTIFENISQITRSNVNYINADFLNYDITHQKKYDMIIGNPPYFVCGTKGTGSVPKHLKGVKKDKSDTYYTKSVGRIQIYVLFILHSLAKLKDNGVLGFILPKSILNSSYYMKTRKYIYENYELLDIIDYGQMEFEDTDQETIGLIIKNNKCDEKEENKFIFKLGTQIFFTAEKEKLASCYENSKRLCEMGFSVKTGPVVWNEHKDKVTNDNKCQLLLYNSNIEKNNILIKKFKNNEKGQYIDFKDKIEELPIIVCNRGNGNAKYKLNFAYIDETVLEELSVKNKIHIQDICVENHLNVIYYKKKDKTKEEIKVIMKNICEKLGDDEKIQLWSSIFLGNNGFSKTELEFYLPIPL